MSADEVVVEDTLAGLVYYPKLSESLELSARTQRVSFLTSPSCTKSSYHTSHHPRYNFPTSVRLSESVGDCVKRQLADDALGRFILIRRTVCDANPPPMPLDSCEIISFCNFFQKNGGYLMSKCTISLLVGHGTGMALA